MTENVKSDEVPDYGIGPEWDELETVKEEKLKLVPRADDAETEILQVMILDENCLRLCADILKPEHFLRWKQQKLYAAILTLFRAGKAVEPLGLKNTLVASGDFDQLDALALINATLDFGGFNRVGPFFQREPKAWLAWCEQIVIAAAKRFLLDASEQVKAQAKDGERALDEIIADLRRELVQIENVGLRKRSVALVIELDNPEITAAVTGQVIPTGFTELDRLLRGGGFTRGDLVFIGARTSRGKSTLAFQMAANAAAAGQVVAFFAFEMKRTSVIRRMLTIRAELPYSSVQRGSYEAAELQRMMAEMRAMTRWRIEICDQRRMTWTDIQRECRAIKQANDNRLDLVIVDYLELIWLERAYGSRAEELSVITRDAKLFAGEPDVDCPVIIPVQIKRASLTGEKFDLSAFRGSGSIEQDADKCLIIQEPEDEMPESYQVELTLAKQREGGVGSIRMTFDRTFGGFRENYNSAVFGLTGTTREKKRQQKATRSRGRAWDRDDESEEF